MVIYLVVTDMQVVFLYRSIIIIVYTLSTTIPTLAHCKSPSSSLTPPGDCRTSDQLESSIDPVAPTGYNIMV